MRRNVLCAALAVVAAGTIPAGCHAQVPQAPTESANARPVSGTVWSAPLLASLRGWIDSAPSYGLPRPDCGALEAAEKADDASAIDRAAEALALRLAQMHATGWSAPAVHAAWHIVDSDTQAGLAQGLHAAMATGSLDAFYTGLQPVHPDFAALRAALAQEADAARRATLARNLERWRWLPRDLGRDFVLVNAAAFRVELWRDGARVGMWRVIVGKPSSPTPVFAATVTGVTLNPWWDIPANIVAESVGAMVRRHPALARKRGYVWGGGRYRQRPGVGNALGAMKLAMPNGFNVYLHDTPTKALFEKDVRTFSHGCVRVDQALDFATALLTPSQDRAAVDAIVASGQTVTLPVPRRMPVYIAYFTAIAGPDGKGMVLPDVYGRDSAMGDATIEQKRCAA